MPTESWRSSVSLCGARGPSRGRHGAFAEPRRHRIPCQSVSISELIGYSCNPLREVVSISPSLSFLNCKINSSEQSRCGTARVGAVCPTLLELRALKPDRGGGYRENSLSYVCLRLLTFSSPPCFFKVRLLMTGRTMKFLFFRFG